MEPSDAAALQSVEDRIQEHLRDMDPDSAIKMLTWLMDLKQYATPLYESVLQQLAAGAGEMPVGASSRIPLHPENGLGIRQAVLVLIPDPVLCSCHAGFGAPDVRKHSVGEH